MVATRINVLRSKRVNKRNLYNNLRAELEPGFICTFSNNTGVSLPHFFPEKRCPHRLTWLTGSSTFRKNDVPVV